MLIRDVDRERVRTLTSYFTKKKKKNSSSRMNERFGIGTHVWVSHQRSGFAKDLV